MRAAIFEKPGHPLKIETIPDPTPAPLDVVIAVHRCGICASDLHLTEAHADPSLPPLFQPGSVIGHEFTGEVVALGSEVDRLKTGDRIAAMAMTGCGRCRLCRNGEPWWCSGMRLRAGGFAEFALVQQDVCVKLPSTVSQDDGALIEPVACGLHAALLAEISPGARVMVIGAGPIALGTIFWARLLGAGPIVAVATSRRRETLARAVGATDFVVSHGDLPADIAQALRGMPDLVIECVGVPGLVDLAVASVRPRGTIVVAGFCAVPDAVSHSVATLKQVRVQYSVAYSRDEFQKTADIFDTGRPELTSMITDHVSMDQFPDAFETLRNGSTQCKVMLTPRI